MVPALLKWIGNKQKVASTIVSYMPDVFSNYYEPFLGSGAVLAELLFQDATSMFPHFEYAYASDILPFLIEIFDIVKDNLSEEVIFVDIYDTLKEHYEKGEYLYFRTDHHWTGLRLLGPQLFH